MKKLTFLFLGFLLSATVQASNLAGKWNFEAPDAPIGFRDGTVEFKNINNKACAEINFGLYSFLIDITETEANQYNSHVPIMGTDIDLSLDNTDGKMKTTVNVMGMEINVTLKEMQK